MPEDHRRGPDGLEKTEKFHELEIFLFFFSRVIGACFALVRSCVTIKLANHKLLSNESANKTSNQRAFTSDAAPQGANRSVGRFESVWRAFSFTFARPREKPPTREKPHFRKGPKFLEIIGEAFYGIFSQQNFSIKNRLIFERKYDSEYQRFWFIW